MSKTGSLSGGGSPRLPNRRLQIEYRPLQSLQRAPDTLRRHSEAQLAQITGSLSAFGFARPIVIDDNGQIIDGHALFEAACRLNLDNVPVMCVSGLTASQLSALSIALNRLAEKGDWNTDALRERIEVLCADPDIDFPLEILGFDQVYIDALLLTDGAPDDQADEPIEPPAAAVARPGDLWRLGRHLLWCGDSRRADGFAELMGGELARLNIADVPYNLPIERHVSGLGRRAHKDFAMACGEMERATFVAFQTQVMEHCAEVSVDGALHYWFIDGRHVRDQIEAGEAAFGELKQLCVWVKPTGGMGTFYRSRHELLTIWKQGAAPHINNFGLGESGRYRTNVFEYPGYNGAGKGRGEALSWHPTVKPTALVADIILDVTHRGDVVLDPFGGSGTTLIAAERTGRTARLIEIDPAFVDVTLRRFSALGGEAPVLAETGEPFEAVEQRRSAEPRAPDTPEETEGPWNIL